MYHFCTAIADKEVATEDVGTKRGGILDEDYMEEVMEDFFMEEEQINGNYKEGK